MCLQWASPLIKQCIHLLSSCLFGCCGQPQLVNWWKGSSGFWFFPQLHLKQLLWFGSADGRYTETWSDADRCWNYFCACYSCGNPPHGKAAGTSAALQWTGLNWKGWGKYRKAVWPTSHFQCFHCCHLSLEKSHFSPICVFKCSVFLAFFFFLLIKFRLLVFPKSFILHLSFLLLSIPGEFCLTKSVDRNWPIINRKIK